MIQIITDSTADIPAEIAARAGIIVVPCQVIFGDAAYREDVDLTSAEFFQKLRTSTTLPQTALPRGEDFAAAYREAEERGATGVLAIHLGSTFSGVFNAARLYGEEVTVPTEFVDSGTSSLAMGLLALHAARRASAGVELEELAAEIRSLARGAELYAMLDTLKYARRGGRVGRVTEAVASVLNIKPILRIAHNSIDLVSRHRSVKRALHALVETVREVEPQHGVAVIHAETPNRAAELAERVREVISSDRDVIVHTAGAVLSTHAGPGAVGIGLVREGEVV